MYTSTNLDKLKQIMAESAEHKAVITQLLDSHKETVSMITHEIRNPLTLMYSTLQLIESAHPEVHTFQHWDSLHGDFEYLIQLLTELSTYNNGSSLHPTSLNTVPFLKKTVLSFAASAAARSVEFTSYIAPDLPPIQGDAVKLKEVLLNLFKNACEACTPDKMCSIFLKADTAAFPDTEAPCLRIRITDTGCGIAPEHLEQIFQPFVTYKSGGTGLGLPLSKRIIEAHGGTLQVSSVLGSGTTFTILLPFCPSAALDDTK